MALGYIPGSLQEKLPIVADDTCIDMEHAAGLSPPLNFLQPRIPLETIDPVKMILSEGDVYTCLHPVRGRMCADRIAKGGNSIT